MKPAPAITLYTALLADIKRMLTFVPQAVAQIGNAKALMIRIWQTITFRHSRVGGNPAPRAETFKRVWIPAFAGMTQESYY